MDWYKIAQKSASEAMQILELSSNFTLNDLNRQRKRLMRNWHPDVNKDPQALEMAKKINAAYSILQQYLQEEKSDYGYGGYVDEEGVDVPPPFNQKEEEPITQKDVFNYVSYHTRDYIEDFLYEPIPHWLEPEELRIWPTKYWLSAKVFSEYFSEILITWEKIYKRKLSRKFKQEFLDYAADLYAMGESFPSVIWLLNRYISENYETKNIIERTKDFFGNFRDRK
jgi:curved DNA-binding protein CbpA